MIRRILNTNVEFIDYPELKSVIFGKIKERSKFTVTYANSHVCVSALKNPVLAGCLGKFDLVHPDGIAVHIAHKYLYSPGKRSVRVNGTDFYDLLFTDGTKFKCFLLGGPEDGAEKINKKFGNNVDVCGYIAGPGNQIQDSEKINGSGADILFVALGTPVQEEWIIRNRGKINVPVIIATGSGIDFLSGKKRRAPEIMRKLGLEWLFRLFSEPARLWKRYLILNPVFIFKIMAQKLKLNLKQGNT